MNNNPKTENNISIDSIKINLDCVSSALSSIIKTPPKTDVQRFILICKSTLYAQGANKLPQIAGIKRSQKIGTF